jgi:hypothetical protein
MHTKDHIAITNYNNDAQDNYPCLLHKVKLFGLQAEFSNLILSGTDWFTLQDYTKIAQNVQGLIEMVHR